ncbi:hypothetical protein OH76DRAFT_943707 [Lentinus brumalis]|uniref:Uncharacterized protein n=1 Tax=Lentinus brumalis TaxID=2498619 RepID=A0A371CZ28_9APHY|nr:hypothetical protein OH76DRAFT_943707 [Polyporus brumalis]
MAENPMQNPRVMKIPFPGNVDPSWRMELYDTEDPNSTGFHVGAYMDMRHYQAYSRLSMTISDRIPQGHLIQALRPGVLFQYVVRSLLPGERISLSNTYEVALISEKSWGDILWHMVDAQSKWWKDSLAQVSPRAWGHGNTHPAWWAWALKPSPERLWYVAIRRTLPDERRGIPSYYFPEAELRL